jgi:two-component system, response regulator FlrC
MDRLTRHRWRGNVRELENAMHRAVLLASGEEIGPDAITTSEPANAAAPADDRSAAAPADNADPISPLVGRRMEEVEQALILGTLHSTAGNRTHAATILGISIRALRNKLRDYASQGVTVPPPVAGVAA